MSSIAIIFDETATVECVLISFILFDVTSFLPSNQASKIFKKINRN